MERPQRFARRSEQHAARLHGARLTPGSGSGRAAKSDFRNDTYLFENKYTEQKGYRLTEEDLIKAEGHANTDGRKMAFRIEFGGPGGSSTRHGTYVVMTESDFLEREDEMDSLRESAWAYEDLRNS